jgi:rhamnopyranosyl-N-acetylglucosaminyl-diphospho-decaprenol beta-1,3/1,4-galactofuranosyltransferase
MKDRQILNTPKITTESEGKDRCFDIVSIVVTHNRKKLLLKCLDLLINQSTPTDILIVNNASTDGTEQELKSTGLIDNIRIHYIYLNVNTGGAGGFHYGLKYAFEQGWDWFWLMDDDAEPHKSALEKLFYQGTDKESIYGSAAISRLNEKVILCFGVKRYNQNKSIEYIDEYKLLNSSEQVVWLPFLGFLIHRNTVLKIGLPDKIFFIRNDDLEYGERAKRHGIKIYLIKESIIEHPLQPTMKFILFGITIYHRSMPAWKMYYEVRNKIIVSKRYYSLLGWIRVMSGVSLQIILCILTEKCKKAYIKSFFQGLTYGIFKT